MTLAGQNKSTKNLVLILKFVQNLLLKKNKQKILTLSEIKIKLQQNPFA